MTTLIVIVMLQIKMLMTTKTVKLMHQTANKIIIVKNNRLQQMIKPLIKLNSILLIVTIILNQMEIVTANSLNKIKLIFKHPIMIIATYSHLKMKKMNKNG